MGLSSTCHRPTTGLPRSPDESAAAVRSYGLYALGAPPVALLVLQRMTTARPAASLGRRPEPRLLAEGQSPKGDTSAPARGAGGEGGRAAPCCRAVPGRLCVLIGVSARCMTESKLLMAPTCWGLQAESGGDAGSPLPPASSWALQAEARRVCTAARPGGSPSSRRLRSPRSLSLDCRLATCRSASWAARLLVAELGWLAEEAATEATPQGEQPAGQAAPQLNAPAPLIARGFCGDLCGKGVPGCTRACNRGGRTNIACTTCGAPSPPARAPRAAAPSWMRHGSSWGTICRAEPPYKRARGRCKREGKLGNPHLRSLAGCRVETELHDADSALGPPVRRREHRGERGALHGTFPRCKGAGAFAPHRSRLGQRFPSQGNAGKERQEGRGGSDSTNAASRERGLVHRCGKACQLMGKAICRRSQLRERSGRWAWQQC